MSLKITTLPRMTISETETAQLHDLMGVLRQRVDAALDTHLPSKHCEPKRLHEAMRYAVLNGGKRVRAILVYTAGRAAHAVDAWLDRPAAAVELIHAYSLVHDDLPAMDDDDLRRGKPSCHRAFDEASALLAGDALQTLAFCVMASEENPLATRTREMVETLARASGSAGMAGGQAIDLAAVGGTLSLGDLENMHVHKTGALIRAAVKLGGLANPEVEKETLERLDQYARCIGLAFQIRDDILDVEGDTITLGKQQGADEARNKPTYPALLGLDQAKRMARELHHEAVSYLTSLGPDADPLRWLSAYIVTRPS